MTANLALQFLVEEAEGLLATLWLAVGPLLDIAQMIHFVCLLVGPRQSSGS